MIGRHRPEVLRKSAAGTNRAARLLIVTLAASGLLPSASDAARFRRSITFEERVRAQEAIERVYYSHQTGVALRFEDLVPRALIEKKVRTYLKQSRALETIWSVSLSADMLRREIERIAAQTRMPERLREVYAVLGDDPVLIAECLARPSLVDRLARRQFEDDLRIHAQARREIEDLRDRLLSGNQDPAQPDPRRTVIEYVMNAAGPDSSGETRGLTPAAAESGDPERRALDPDDFARLRSSVPARVGEVGPIINEPGRYVLQVLSDEATGRFILSRYEVPKVTWDAWWQGIEKTLDESRVPNVTDALDVLPAPRGRGEWELSAADSSTAGTIETAGVACPPDDTWSPFLPEPRDHHTAVWTGSEMIVWGGHTFVPGIGDRLLNTGARYDPVLASWTPVSTENAPPPTLDHVAVWTGSEMLVWGGANRAGGRYDPVTDGWTSMSTLGAPLQTRCQAIWTGQEMIAWCSFESSGNEGARYNPSTDTWTAISTLNAPDPRHSYSVVWTGTRMIVWGGVGTGGYMNTGGLYDPASDTWVPTSILGAPSPRYGHSAVWDGQRMIVWGGTDDNPQNSGGRYDPSTNTWTSTSTVGAPPARSGHPAIWAGTEMIVWGGAGASGIALSSGGRYSPSTDTWSIVRAGPDVRSGHTLVWTGRLMILWGGIGSRYIGIVERYDPASDAWLAPATDGPGPRSGHSAVWTGNLMLVWGGLLGNPSVLTNTGGRYDPVLDAWSPTSTFGAPAARTDHAAIWSGQEMIIWGGGLLTTGGRYDPVSDTWKPTPTSGAPSPRNQFSAVWTGREMIVWGGVNLVQPSCCYYNDGARYDPAADQWTPVPATGALNGRAAHSAVWTGQEMIVWGGYYTFDTSPGNRVTVYLNTGARYDPSTGLWTSTSMTSAPAARSFHAGVFTGSVMVIWGGTNGAFLNTGGRYDPLADAWAPTSTVNAPNRFAGFRVSIWTGSVLIIWGQNNGPTDAGTGGRYDPIADAWVPTSIVSAPLPDGTAVWTGGMMLLWGGRNRTSRYFLSPDADRDGFTVCAGDCNDANSAIHPGASETCNGVDDDCNGIVDNGFDQDGDGVTTCAGDCDDSSPLVWHIPGEVSGLGVGSSQPSVLGWNSQALQAGSGTTYDLVSGVLRSNSVGPEFASSACLYSDASTSYSDTRPDPAVRTADWYLVRARNSCGKGTFGTPQQDLSISACP